MAGKYSRFRDAGYKIPKYLLPFGCRTILDEILLALVGRGASVVENVFLVANKDDEPFMGHVRKIMDAYGISRTNLLLIDDTAGQAQTSNDAMYFFEPKGPVVVHNADTILYGRDMAGIALALKSCAGYIDVFESSNHAYSYVVAKEGRVEMIGEKVLVSNLATSGLYGFSSRHAFHNHYDGQMYISEVYKEMLLQKREVRIGTIYSEKDTIVLGTPEDYIKHSEGL